MTLSTQYEALFARGWGRPKYQNGLEVFHLCLCSLEECGDPDAYWVDDMGACVDDCDLELAMRECRLAVIEGLQGWSRATENVLRERRNEPGAERDPMLDLWLKVSTTLSHGATDEAYIALANRVLDARGGDA